MTARQPPDTERLLALIDAMAGRPVLMLADLVADRFITGSPKRISREAPVLILSHESDLVVPGGGGNAVMNVGALGGRPLPIGAVGTDDAGTRLLEAFGEHGITTEGVRRVEGYRTPTKIRILGGGRHSIKQQIVRYDIEDSLRPDDEHRTRIAEFLERWAGTSSVAVLSDYGYGAVLPELVPSVREALAEDGRILCDSRYRLGEFHGIDGATPNEEEALALLDPGGRHGPGILEEGPARLLARMGLRYLVVTRGSYGMSLFEPASSCHIPVHGTDEVADVTGAGDTVIGAFSLAIAAGATALEATLLANYAGGVVVSKAGTATVSPAELRAAVASDPRPLEELEWDGS